MSRFPYRIITPQPSTLPVLLISNVPALAALPYLVILHTGGVALTSPTPHAQLLLVCVHAHGGQPVAVASSSRLSMKAFICAMVGADAGVEIDAISGGPSW